MPDQIPPSSLPRILLVEDHDMTRRMQVRFLSRQYAVDFASTGREAIEQATAHPYQTILLDINLADRMNGVEVMQRIKQLSHHRSTAIVAVTGYASPEDRQRLLGAGFDLYLAKPFKWKEFSEVIELAVRITASGTSQPAEPPSQPEPLWAAKPQPAPEPPRRPAAPHPAAERRPLAPYPAVGEADESSDGRSLFEEPILSARMPQAPPAASAPSALLPRWESLSSI
jgi:CheY-like chemotaxis protein